MRRLYINRAIEYTYHTIRIKTWFDVSRSCLYVKDNSIQKLTTLEYSLPYQDLKLKLENKVSIEEMTTYFFWDFLSKNKVKLIKMITYANHFDCDDDLKIMIREYKDFISIMLQTVYEV